MLKNYTHVTMKGAFRKNERLLGIVSQASGITDLEAIFAVVILAVFIPILVAVFVTILVAVFVTILVFVLVPIFIAVAILILTIQILVLVAVLTAILALIVFHGKASYNLRAARVKHAARFRSAVADAAADPVTGLV
mgnify:CR=1 FL=1